MIATGKVVTNAKKRDRSFNSANRILLSIRGDHAEVQTLLGDLNAARAVTCLQGGGTDDEYRLAAVAAYSRALVLDPSCTLVWNQLAIIYMHFGKAAEAIKYLKMMVVELLVNAGVVENEENESKANDTKTTVDAPTSSSSSAASSSSSSSSSPPTPSIDKYTTYTPFTSADHAVLSLISPSRRIEISSVLSNYGVCLYMLNLSSVARLVYLDSLSLAPRHSDTYMNLGNLYRTEGDVESALRALNTAINIKPNHALAWMSAALVYMHKRDWITAYQMMENANKVR